MGDGGGAVAKERRRVGDVAAGNTYQGMAKSIAQQLSSESHLVALPTLYICIAWKDSKMASGTEVMDADQNESVHHCA